MTYPGRRQLQLVIPRPVVVADNSTVDGVDAIAPGNKGFDDPSVSRHEEPALDGDDDPLRPGNTIYSDAGSSSVNPTTFLNATMAPSDSSSTAPDPTDDLSNDDDGDDAPLPTASSEDRGFTPFPTEHPTTFDDNTPMTIPPNVPPVNAPTTHGYPRPSRPSSSQQQHNRTPLPPPHHPSAPTHQQQQHHQKQPPSPSPSCGQSDSLTVRLICSHPMGIMLVLVFGILLCIWRCHAQKRREDMTRGEYRAVAAHITDNAFDNTFADDYSYNDDDDDEYDSEEDEFGWSGGKRHVIEMKKMGDDEHSG